MYQRPNEHVLFAWHAFPIVYKQPNNVSETGSYSNAFLIKPSQNEK